jgi:hypothetical protein
MTTFLAFISLTLPRSSRIVPMGVGLKKLALSDAVTKRGNDRRSSGVKFSSRILAAVAEPALWQSINEAISPP